VSGATAVLRACIILLLLASCGEVRQYEVSNQPSASNPIVIGAVQSTFSQAKMPGAPEVSRIRAAHPVSDGDWRMCLRSSDPAHQARYALYFRGYTFVKSQGAVIVDRCGVEDYLPFTPNVAVNATPVGQPTFIGLTAGR
jgi:hypothetical protein